MNTKRIIFWACFIIILGLIVWGLVVAMNKPVKGTLDSIATPPDVSASDHVRGNTNASVTLLEYSDFQCPACESYYPVVEKVYNQSSSTIRFVYRHFPLNNTLPDGSIQHPNALAASKAAEAAGKQGKFWEMYGLLFANHTDWTELKDPRDMFGSYAAQLGLNLTKFKSDFAASSTEDFILGQKNEGVKIGINGTPTFFINGKAIQNPQSYDAFQATIDAAVAASAK